MPHHAFLAATAVALLLGPAGCKSRPGSQSEVKGLFNPAAAGGGLAPESEQLWADYVKSEFHSGNIVDDCKPRRFDPPAGTPVKGVVVMFHGFTACPQQYFELGELVAKEGYVALLPLAPGHGYRPLSNGKEYFGSLLDDSEWVKYDDLVKKMNAIVAPSTAIDRVAVGLSLGGAMATRAIQSGVYSRHLIMAPFYEPGSTMGEAAKQIHGALPQELGDYEVGWGDDCVANKARAGYCMFAAKHVNAVRLFGNGIQTNAIGPSVPKPGTATQILIVENDSAIDNNYVAQVLQHFQASGATVSGCMYRGGLPHSFFSRKDNAALDAQGGMYWLPSFLDEATQFITQGKAFASSGSAGSLAPFQVCSGANGGGGAAVAHGAPVAQGMPAQGAPVFTQGAPMPQGMPAQVNSANAMVMKGSGNVQVVFPSQPIGSAAYVTFKPGCDGPWKSSTINVNGYGFTCDNCQTAAIKSGPWIFGFGQQMRVSYLVADIGDGSCAYTVTIK